MTIGQKNYFIHISGNRNGLCRAVLQYSNVSTFLATNEACAYAVGRNLFHGDRSPCPVIHRGVVQFVPCFLICGRQEFASDLGKERQQQCEDSIITIVGSCEINIFSDRFF